MVFLQKKWMAFLLIAAGLITRFLFVWWPGEVVFDEVHFGKFISGYFTHEYFFDIHPPLGKLLIAFAAWIGGFHSGFSFSDIGLSYGELPYTAMRFLPNLAGALIPFAAFWLFSEMGMGKRAAFLAGALLLLDNALLVQSHFILVDAFLMLFGLMGLALFFRSRSARYSPRLLAISGLFFALSISVKWTGLAYLACALLVIFLDSLRQPLAFWKAHWAIPIHLVLVPLAAYAAIFWVHFSLLTAPGPGDPFMQQGFQERSLFARFVELNAVMYGSNASLSATHPYASKYYTWPAMVRPVYYWVKNIQEKTARIYLLGNPVVWWGSTLGGLLAFFFWRSASGIHRLLALFWVVQFVPFVFIGRVMFLYHYLPALAFAAALLAGWVGELEERKKIRLAPPFLLAALIGFVFFAPLTYGFALSDAAYKMRVWLPSWI